MNLVERSMHSVDAWQQKSPWAAPAFGVIRKFGDDRGPSLAALLTYYSFLALFPMLLVMATVLGYIGNEKVAQSVLGSALGQFPVVGEQLGRDAAQPLQGSPVALTVGIVGSLYGSLGATQVAQRVMADVWNVPNVVRPGFAPRLGRSVGVLGLLALATVVGAAAGLVAGSVGSALWARSATFLLVTALHVGFFALILRVLTPKQIPTKELRAGSVVGGIGYTALLAIGTALVQHQLRHAEALYGQFGFVLGLLGWLYLVAQIAIYAGEINVVLERHLWPRSLIQPPLTRADEQVLSAIAHQEERRPEQTVAVAFESRPVEDGDFP